MAGDRATLTSCIQGFMLTGRLAWREQAQEPRGLPSLPAVPDLGLPSMPAIALPSNAEALLAPIPAPRPQGPAAAAAYEAARPYTAFYNILPVLKDTGLNLSIQRERVGCTGKCSIAPLI